MGEGVETEITPFAKWVFPGDPGRQADNTPGTPLPPPSGRVLWLRPGYLLHMTSAPSLVVWGWGQRCEHPALSAQAVVMPSAPITK